MDRPGAEGPVTRNKPEEVCPRCDPLLQRLAIDQFQDQAADAVRFFDTVDRPDVRVIQCGQHSRLAFEARAPLGVGRERGRKEFDRHFAPKRLVVGAVDLAHATNSDQGADRIDPEAFADERALRLFENRRHGDSRHGSAHETRGLMLLREQRFKLALESVIAQHRPSSETPRVPLPCGPAPRERRSWIWRQRSGVILPVPPHSVPAATTASPTAQSRLTVSREMFNTSAVSSMLRPPKNRISTT